jgi:hypothetical protein
LENTNISYFGGTLAQKDSQVLKRLLFRATRGRAIMTTFDLEIEQEDVIRGDNFHAENIGYIVLVEDNGPLRTIAQRVCKSFSTSEDNRVYEI